MLILYKEQREGIFYTPRLIEDMTINEEHPVTLGARTYYIRKFYEKWTDQGVTGKKFLKHHTDIDKELEYLIERNSRQIMIHYLYGVDEIPNFRNDEEAAKWMIINQYLIRPLENNRVENNPDAKKTKHFGYIPEPKEDTIDEEIFDCVNIDCAKLDDKRKIEFLAFQKRLRNVERATTSKVFKYDKRYEIIYNNTDTIKKYLSNDKEIKNKAKQRLLDLGLKKEDLNYIDDNKDVYGFISSTVDVSPMELFTNLNSNHPNDDILDSMDYNDHINTDNPLNNPGIQDAISGDYIGSDNNPNNPTEKVPIKRVQIESKDEHQFFIKQQKKTKNGFEDLEDKDHDPGWLEYLKLDFLNPLNYLDLTIDYNQKNFKQKKVNLEVMYNYLIGQIDELIKNIETDEKKPRL